jgi:SET domain-containing protein
LKEKKTPDLVEVRRSAIAGRGVFARHDIPAKTLLADVSRPLVRYAQVPQEGEPGYGHAIQVSRGWWLLLDHSPFYYLNHRCRSNTRLRFRGARVTVETERAIRRGEELTLDYATVAFRDDPYHFSCHCGSAACRGVVRGERPPAGRRTRARGRARPGRRSR